MLVLETEHGENPVLDSEQNLKRRRKMPKIDIEPNGRFSTALKIAIEKKGLSLTDVAQKADSTYENMRKLVVGAHSPLGICSVLWLQFLGRTVRNGKNILKPTNCSSATRLFLSTWGCRPNWNLFKQSYPDCRHSLGRFC
jgi:hypothetical protein